MLATSNSQMESIISKKSTLQPWIVCLSAALFFFYEFIQMGMFNSISPELMHEFNINATQMGYLSATYFYADVAFLFFAGIVLDHYSTRFIILCAMALCILSTIVFALSHSVLLAGASHFVAGIGNAFCFLSCIKLSSRWFPAHRMALVIGLIVTMAMAGGVFAQTPLTLLVELLGWRHAVMADALLGVLIFIVIWSCVYDKPANNDDQIQLAPTSTSPTNLRESIRFALSNPQNWLGGIYTCLLNLPIFLLGALWGVMYLSQAHNIPRTQASYITTMIFIGTIIGSPIVGWISDHIGKRRLPMIIGAIVSLIIILAIIYLPNLDFTSLLLLFLALGIATSTQIISYPTIAESNPKALTGTATGVASVLIMGGGAVFQPFFGWLMDLHWNGLTVNNVAMYSHQDYLRGMAIMPIAFLIGLLAAILMRDTRCQPYK